MEERRKRNTFGSYKNEEREREIQRRKKKKEIEQCQNQRYFHCGKVQNKWRLCVTRHPINHYCFSLPLSLFLPSSISLSSFPATECNRKWMQFTQDIGVRFDAAVNMLSVISSGMVRKMRDRKDRERERKEESERVEEQIQKRTKSEKWKRHSLRIQNMNLKQNEFETEWIWMVSPFSLSLNKKKDRFTSSLSFKLSILTFFISSIIMLQHLFSSSCWNSSWKEEDTNPRETFSVH